MKARQNDPELAKLVAAEDTTEKWRPALEDWSLLHGMVAQLINLQSDIAVILARGLPSNGTRTFPEPFPVPETEIDKARKKAKAAKEAAEDKRLTDIVSAAKARYRAQQTQEPS